MDWLVELLTRSSVAHAVLIYSFVIASGVLLGKIKIGGISLGVTFVLFMGILVGHFGVNLNPDLMHFLKEFGLILFIFSIGLQVGPSFFTSFKKGGMLLNGLACLLVALGIGVTLSLFYIFHGDISMPMLVGIMQGAVTNTPGLGAAQEALRQLSEAGELTGPIPSIGLGYAVAYPMGVIGVLLSFMILRLLFRVKLDKEEEALKAQKETHETPNWISIQVHNESLAGCTLLQCQDLVRRQFVASRLYNGEKVIIPSDETPLQVGDILSVVVNEADEKAVTTFLGKKVDYVWEDSEKEMVSRRIVVTQSSINGKTIGSLAFRSTYGVNITRVHRSGIDLLARPELYLQVGDRVTVVGSLEAIGKVEKILGNTLKRLNEPHLIAIFFGICAGILVGSMPFHFPNMPMPAKLGLAGGPLIVAILLGRFGYRLKLITYTTQSANLMLREMGISLFLASVGISAGAEFVDTVVSPDGLLWIACGVLITMLPALIVGIIGRLLKINYFTLIGMISGSCTNPPALAYSSSIANNDAPAVAYSTVYPLTMFLRIICAQFIILLFA
ncbi:MAG: putative transporter [Paludibacteraceae bacterium]|jgi:putative transport protein|nr:putative transporter [Paludibacteraceae bacterium]